MQSHLEIIEHVHKSSTFCNYMVKKVVLKRSLALRAASECGFPANLPLKVPLQMYIIWSMLRFQLRIELQ